MSSFSGSGFSGLPRFHYVPECFTPALQHCNDITVHPCATIEAAQALAQRLTPRRVALPVVQQQQPGKRARPVPRPAPLLAASQGVGDDPPAGDERLLRGEPGAGPDAVPRSSSTTEAAHHHAVARASPDSASCLPGIGGEVQPLASGSAVAGDLDGRLMLQTGVEAVAVAVPATDPGALCATDSGVAVREGAGSGSALPLDPAMAGGSAGEKDAVDLSGKPPASPRDSGICTAQLTSDSLQLGTGDPGGNANSPEARPTVEPAHALVQAGGGQALVATAQPESLALSKRAAKRQRRMQRQAEMAAPATNSATAPQLFGLDSFMLEASRDPRKA